MIVKKFYDEFSAFADQNDFPGEFIETPEWAKIMQLAKDVSTAFDYDRNYILNEYLKRIHRITDKEYQRRAWIYGEIGTDFDETVCQYVDYGDPILENYRDFGISDEQYQLLKNFREQFGAFWEDNDWPPDFIETPEWAKIVQLAKDVLTAFDYFSS